MVSRNERRVTRRGMRFSDQSELNRGFTSFWIRGIDRLVICRSSYSYRGCK